MVNNPLPPTGLSRRYLLNMPQMSLCGLSENWLFKELGDIHWSMLVEGLGVPTDAILDESGSRLYATFCRVHIEPSAPLATFKENEEIAGNGLIRRYGQGLFFSEIDFLGDGRSIRANVMSSFAKRGIENSNVDLVKAGVPVISDDCLIENLPAMPTFGSEYNIRRNTPPGPPLFECEYQINPYLDINGVGLLYFAAYQAISDTCELQYIGNGLQWAQEMSTVERDIFYFANIDINEKLFYRVHDRRDVGSEVEIESSLSRSSDGVLMAYALTRKARIER